MSEVKGFSLLEMLVVLAIIGVLLAVSVPRFTPIYQQRFVTDYCDKLSAIRTYLEIKKEMDIIYRCYPTSLSASDIERELDIAMIDPFTGNDINILTQDLSSFFSPCGDVSNTYTIRYCPVVVNSCAYTYKIKIYSELLDQINPNCLLGVVSP